MIPPGALADPVITWIKVDPPRFDLAGILFGSLGLTLALAGLAVLTGILVGCVIIWRRRGRPSRFEATELRLRPAVGPD